MRRLIDLVKIEIDARKMMEADFIGRRIRRRKDAGEKRVIKKNVAPLDNSTGVWNCSKCHKRKPNVVIGGTCLECG